MDFCFGITFLDRYFNHKAENQVFSYHFTLTADNSFNFRVIYFVQKASMESVCPNGPASSVY